MSQKDATKGKKSTKGTKRPMGKGKGKGKAKRRQQKNKDVLEGITKPAIRRLARRAGCKRVSFDIYEFTRQTLHSWLSDVVGDSIIYTDHGKRKTVTASDVVYALKRKGRNLYGY